MYMDDIELFAKNEKDLESLIPEVKIYSQSIGYGKVRHANGTTKSRKIRTLGEKETYKYLGILEADIIKQAEMKEKI